MITDAVMVVERGTIHGKGLVATRPILHDEVVWRLDPDAPTVSCADVAAWPEEKRQAFNYVGFQCSESHFAICQDISRYMNHSCDPNTCWADSHTLVACRDIQPGEEITYDYATTEVTVDWEMHCTCGCDCCRGIVSNRDHLDPAWRARYGNHLPAHVLQAIKNAGG